MGTMCEWNDLLERQAETASRIFQAVFPASLAGPGAGEHMRSRDGTFWKPLDGLDVDVARRWADVYGLAAEELGLTIECLGRFVENRAWRNELEQREWERILII